MGLRLCLSNTLGREVRSEEPLWSLELEESLLEPPVETRLSLSRATGSLWLLSGAGSCSAEPGDGERSTEHVKIPLGFSICAAGALPVLGITGSSSRQRQTGGFGAGRAALSNLKDVQNPQESSPAASRGRGQPSARAVLSCQHSKALLPVPGFTTEVMAGHFVSSCTLPMPLSLYGIYRRTKLPVASEVTACMRS